jgi:hypothetical protein
MTNVYTNAIVFGIYLFKKQLYIEIKFIISSVFMSSVLDLTTWVRRKLIDMQQKKVLDLCIKAENNSSALAHI